MITVEFDGRIAAVARGETGDRYRDAEPSSPCMYRLFLPGRAYGANSTRIVDTVLLIF
jgi:hypothetical protein